MRVWTERTIAAGKHAGPLIRVPRGERALVRLHTDGPVVLRIFASDYGLGLVETVTHRGQGGSWGAPRGRFLRFVVECDEPRVVRLTVEGQT